MRRGFSLVEMSIVLAILGLLVGGIIAGKSMIRGAQLRGITVEYSRWHAATQNFLNRYNGLPGDISDATSYWGRDNANCNTDTGSPKKPGTCNGNGDGTLDNPPTPSTTGEAFQFWKQLALAGYIDGVYSGIAGPSDNNNALIGVNIPASRFPGAGWSVRNWGESYAGNVSLFAGPFGHSFIIGAQQGNGFSHGPIMRADEAQNIDRKLDDGLPGTGSVISYFWSTCTTATSNTDYTAVYKVDLAGDHCSLVFVQQF